MAMNTGFRSFATNMLNSTVSKPVSREFHLSRMRMMGGGHGHGHDEPEYIHAKHMYNLDKMKHRQIKMPLFVFSCFAVGVIVPIYAVVFQQKKAGSS